MKKFMIVEFPKILFTLALCLLFPALLYGKDLNEQSPSVSDTVYFALQTKMIKRATVQKIKWKKSTCYRIVIQLKAQYKNKFERATKNSIGKRFAVTYHGDILSPILPTINSKIKTGQFTIEPFKKRSKALAIMNLILNSQTTSH